MLRQGVIRTAHLDVDAVRSTAREAGYASFVLPGWGLTDRKSFFDAARSTLPLDPSLRGSRSWDALSDSLWEGLHTLQSRRIVILWPNARLMARCARPDFDIALAVFADVATQLADPRAAVGKPKELAVVVECDDVGAA